MRPETAQVACEVDAMNRRFALKATIAAGALAVVSACTPADTGNDIVDIAASNRRASAAVVEILVPRSLERRSNCDHPAVDCWASGRHRSDS